MCIRDRLNSQEDQIRELKETLTETRNEFARSANLASSSLSDGMNSAVEQVRGAAEAVKEGATPGAKPADTDATDDPKLPSETAKPDTSPGSDTEPGKSA